MLMHRVARPLLASWFVAEGVDALRRPADHVGRLGEAWHRVAARVDGAPEVPPDETLRTIVRAHGGATALAGLMLALGKAPRLAACLLTVLTIPVAVMDAPRTGSRTPPASRQAPSAHGDHTFVRDLSLIGGAIIAGADREGRPSLRWRVRHAKDRSPAS